jgi:DNA-binding CsgD family transcriptional regulator
MQRLYQEYQELLSQQEFDAMALDYGKFEAYHPLLQQLSAIKNSGVTVFDLHQQRHIYISRNFESLFGYDIDRAIQEDSAYFDSRIHPDDHIDLMEVGIRTFRFFFNQPLESRSDFKVVNEYRIRNKEDAYIRVIEQHQALELDAVGNVWLALSTLDISPRQEAKTGVQSAIMNFRTGQFVDLPQDPSVEVKLTARESEILQLIKQGHLSKTISDMLSISVHTVNTHRQRILQKFAANNSIEALEMAAKLGLLD